MKCRKCGRTIRRSAKGRMIWHGTSDTKYQQIKEQGINPPNYWGTREVAKYYAETMAKRDNGVPVLVGVRMRDLQDCLEVADEAPPPEALGSQEDFREHWDWGETDDSLMTAHSLKSKCRVYPDKIRRVIKV